MYYINFNKKLIDVLMKFSRQISFILKGTALGRSETPETLLDLRTLINEVLEIEDVSDALIS